MSASSQKEPIDREHDEAQRVVEEEIRKYRSSKYWIGPRERHVASEEDFDRARLAADLKLVFPHLHPEVLMSVIDSKISLLHLR
jgi:hypothetical protein